MNRRIALAPALAAGLVICVLAVSALPALAADPAPYMVKNIKAGAGSSNPSDLTAIGGLLYFSAGDGARGRELWRSDGTKAGTHMVANIAPGSANSNPRDMTLFNGLVYFSAGDRATGRELWVTDGSAAGAHQVADLRPGRKGSDPRDLTVVGSTLFFSADDGYYGRELYRTDGSSVAQVSISGLTGIYPEELTSYGGLLYFVSNGRLWSSDGTTAGTQQVKDRNGHSVGAPEQLTLSGSLLYFAARTRDNLAARHLWRTDGTAAGTRSISAAITPGNLTDVQGRLFFTTDPNAPIELWISNGTTAGTVKVADTGFPDDLTAVGSFLYFTSIGGDGWQSLVVSNGTASGTNSWYSVNTNFGVSMADVVDFDGLAHYTITGALWYDTCPVDCSQYSWAHQTPAPSWSNRDLTVVGDTLFFTGIDQAQAKGRELWAYKP